MFELENDAAAQIARMQERLQPQFPPNYDAVIGPYRDLSCAVESIQQNLRFLLETIPGQWPFNPDIGVGLETYLFENFDSPKLAEFRPALEAQLKKYLSCVKIIDSKFFSTPDDRDNNRVNLTIIYHIPELGVTARSQCSLSGTGHALVESDVLEF